MSASAGRRRVLLTGATGNWGRACLRAFRDRPDLHVTAFTLPTQADRRTLAEFADAPNISLAWGDLTQFADVARAVRSVDVVLHIGAVVSPLADAQPDLARRVNVGSMRNIVAAVSTLPDPGAVAVVGVGSVAETGDRPVPHHWGRVGDPIRVSAFDEYGQTKVAAERLLVDSGLPRWAWLRQTGIFHPALLATRDPILTHQPLAEVMEWASDVDSARLMVALAQGDVPEEFWGGIYNIGGGDEWRLTNWEFQVALTGVLGVRDVRRWYERNWFALGNFHGHWFTDSDRLQELVPFRGDTLESALARAALTNRQAARWAGRVPAWAMKNLVIRPLTRAPRGTMHAIGGARAAEIEAHFGSSERWAGIGDWSTFVAPDPSRTPTFLDHGYDEGLAPAQWSASVYAGAARFRGGELLSDAVTVGDVATRLRWRCGEGHVFNASPRLVLTGGHWCPTCVTDVAGYPRQAERNAFLAQLG